VLEEQKSRVQKFFLLTPLEKLYF